ncbi:MAG: response regulator [Desulfobacterales bacterium]|nr:response regulator [Desulfobacterales bacterium]
MIENSLNTINDKNTPSSDSLRVNVSLLDTLMNLAGELVLGRNQLLQGVYSDNSKATDISSQRIDMITTELQEAIMKTRMQPINTVFSKFTRVVKDLCEQLNKSIDIIIEGKDVELDKNILESIKDPLTHLIINSVNHGIEMPDQRVTSGKKSTGKISIKAFHDAGLVNIVISDDGKGIDPQKIAESALSKGFITEDQIIKMSEKQKTEIVFLPGFSSSDKVKDHSYPDIGMDIIAKSIENLGGVIEINSVPGAETVIHIKLPLTLAIIPSQIISLGSERYALPQINLRELLRVPACDVKNRIEKVGNSDVFRLRGELLPLIDLYKILGIEKKYIDTEKGIESPDRRENIADRRSKRHLVINEKDIHEADTSETIPFKNRSNDRRVSESSATNIAVVSAGSFKYGLIVDDLFDSEEIVVKPLGKHLKNCKAFSGATIMGDGKVGLILDISNIAQMADLSELVEERKMAKAIEDTNKVTDKSAILTFKNSESEFFAAPLSMVQRIERIEASDIELVGGAKVMQYRGGALPLYELSQIGNFKELSQDKLQEVIVFKVKDFEVGLMVKPPLDAHEIVVKLDESTFKQTAINGSMIVNGNTVLFVDIQDMAKKLDTERLQGKDLLVNKKTPKSDKTILFAEGSQLIRDEVATFLNEEGFKVVVAEDGFIAWEILKDMSDQIDLVITSLGMPNMDGFQLTKKIKLDPEYSHLSVIALTHDKTNNNVDESDFDYKIKYDLKELTNTISKRLNLI